MVTIIYTHAKYQPNTRTEIDFYCYTMYSCIVSFFFSNHSGFYKYSENKKQCMTIHIWGEKVMCDTIMLSENIEKESKKVLRKMCNHVLKQCDNNVLEEDIGVLIVGGVSITFLTPLPHEDRFQSVDLRTTPPATSITLRIERSDHIV